MLLAEVDPLDAAGVDHGRLEVAIEGLMLVDVAQCNVAKGRVGQDRAGTAASRPIMMFCSEP